MKNIYDLIRIKEWIKNIFIFLPVFFAADVEQLVYNKNIYIVFLAMCFAASSVYILNDWNDAEKDRMHPVKKNRPLASGVVKSSTAILVASLLFIAALVLSFCVNYFAFSLIIAYLLINIAYSLKLKNYPIIDVTLIASGFIIRILLGGVAGSIPVSKWFVLMTFLLALVLAMGKRRDDLIVKEKREARQIRKSLKGYNIEFINYSIILLSVIAIMCYIMYTVSPEVVARFKHDYLYITIFPVVIGFLRYLQILFVYQNTGSPTTILLKDKIIQFCVISWGFTYSILLYGWF